MRELLEISAAILQFPSSHIWNRIQNDSESLDDSGDLKLLHLDRSVGGDFCESKMSPEHQRQTKMLLELQLRNQNVRDDVEFKRCSNLDV